MKFGLGLVQLQIPLQKQEIRIEQKQILKLMMIQEDRRHPPFGGGVMLPASVDNIISIHEKLRNSGVCGILIGGLANIVCNFRTKQEDFVKHKDIDIYVIDGKNIKDLRDLESGIDWWCLRSAQLTSIDKYNNKSIKIVDWAENINNVKLGFVIHSRKPDFHPGLSVLDRGAFLDLRAKETFTLSGNSSDYLDDDVLEIYKKRYSRSHHVGHCMPKWWQRVMKDCGIQMATVNIETIGYNFYKVIPEFHE
jgi:hypothetical protein